MNRQVCRRFVRKTYCQGDILSWIFDRRFVRKTFCQHVFCETFCQEDILSVQFFCGRILHRRFVRKTNCQDPFWPYFWYVDIIYGMFTLYLVFWPYFWYVDIIVPKMAKNEPKWPKVTQIWPQMAQNGSGTVSYTHLTLPTKRIV